MHNAKVNGLSMGYTKQRESGTTTITENIHLSSSPNEKEGEMMININTEGWSFDANDVDLFCKSIKKFVEQATGKKKASTGPNFTETK